MTAPGPIYEFILQNEARQRKDASQCDQPTPARPFSLLDRLTDVIGRAA